MKRAPTALRTPTKNMATNPHSTMKKFRQYLHEHRIDCLIKNAILQLITSAAQALTFRWYENSCRFV